MTSPTVRCDTCESLVELKREKDRTLSLVCGCADSRSVELIRTAPAGWGL